MTSSLSHKYHKLLNIRLSGSPTAELLDKINADIRSGKKFYIVTPNPEQVMLAVKDSGFLAVLNAADVSLADGAGLLAANRFLKLKVEQKGFLRIMRLLGNGLMVGVNLLINKRSLEDDFQLIHGRDFFIDLIKLADKNSWKVYLLGGESNEVSGTIQTLSKYYINVKFKGSAGPILDINGTAKTSTDKSIENNVIKDINSFSPQLLFVGFGAPKQEKWLYRRYKDLKIGGAMVHGGTFRYFSGHAVAAPLIFDKAGLTWLWRIISGDQKFGRVYTAVVKFPLYIFKTKLHQP